MMFPLVVRAPHASLLPCRPKRNLGSLQHPPNLHCRPRSTSCGRNTVRLPRFRGSPALCVDQAATCVVPVDGLDVAPRHGTKKVHPSSHGGRRSRSKGWSIRRCLAVHAMCGETLPGHLSHKSQRCPRSRVNPILGPSNRPPVPLGYAQARDRPRASNVNGISFRNEQLPAPADAPIVWRRVQVRGVASEQPRRRFSSAAC